MGIILVDHNMKGHALRLWDMLVAQGWEKVFPLEMVMFADVGLAVNSSDREVWRFAQTHRMILLTDNRNMKGNDSLAQTLAEENTSGSFPVITIGKVDRLKERDYRERCVFRLVEIMANVENFLGAGRIFIP